MGTSSRTVKDRGKNFAWSFFLSGFSEPVPAVALYSCSWMTGVDPDVAHLPQGSMCCMF